MSYFQVCAVWTFNGDQQLTMHFFDAKNKSQAIRDAIDEIFQRIADDGGLEGDEWSTYESEKHPIYYHEWYLDEVITLNTLENTRGPYFEMIADDAYKGAYEIWIARGLDL